MRYAGEEIEKWYELRACGTRGSGEIATEDWCHLSSAANSTNPRQRSTTSCKQQMSSDRLRSPWRRQWGNSVHYER